MSLLPVALFLWISEKFFQASVYGNSVRVSNSQYKETHEITQSLSQQLKLEQTPETFIVNSNGVINALTVRFLSGKYVILYSSLVDLLWCNKGQHKLRTIVAHELAHHAAGHSGWWPNLFMKPALIIPFLGAAYRRSCELTADRIAAELVGNEDEVTATLIAIASGSNRLVPQTSQEAFLRQEHNVPGFFGFLQEVLSSHPRMTKRIVALEGFYHSGLYSGSVQADKSGQPPAAALVCG